MAFREFGVTVFPGPERHGGRSLQTPNAEVILRLILGGGRFALSYPRHNDLGAKSRECRKHASEVTVEGEQVRGLEEEVEAAIVAALRKSARDGRFNLPPDRVYHLMAKAAVAVFEAVADAEGRR